MRKLPQADRMLGEGKDIADVCQELGVSEQTSLPVAGANSLDSRRPFRINRDPGGSRLEVAIDSSDRSLTNLMKGRGG